MSDDEIRAPDNVFKETLINSSKEFLENTNYNEDFELNKAIQESILEVNEYNTSKLYNKTFKELENVSVRKNKYKKHLHEILTPKEETERCIFVNRDKNACKNILYLGKYFLRNQSRPIEFCQKSKEKIVVKQRKPR
jgi:hypothetical protein